MFPPELLLFASINSLRPSQFLETSFEGSLLIAHLNFQRAFGVLSPQKLFPVRGQKNRVAVFCLPASQFVASGCHVFGVLSTAFCCRPTATAPRADRHLTSLSAAVQAILILFFAACLCPFPTKSGAQNIDSKDLCKGFSQFFCVVFQGADCFRPTAKIRDSKYGIRD